MLVITAQVVLCLLCTNSSPLYCTPGFTQSLTSKKTSHRPEGDSLDRQREWQGDPLSSLLFKQCYSTRWKMTWRNQQRHLCKSSTKGRSHESTFCRRCIDFLQYRLANWKTCWVISKEVPRVWVWRSIQTRQNSQKSRCEATGRGHNWQYQSGSSTKKWRCEVPRTNNKVRASGVSGDQKPTAGSMGSVPQIQTGQELTSKPYRLCHRMRLFSRVIAPTLTYASGTWTLSKERERMIKSTQRKMLRLIVQTKRKYMPQLTISKVEVLRRSESAQYPGHTITFFLTGWRIITTTVRHRKDYLTRIVHGHLMTRRNDHRQTGSRCAKAWKWQNRADHDVPKLRRTVCITLIDCLIRQCICRLMKFSIYVPNVPR